MRKAIWTALFSVVSLLAAAAVGLFVPASASAAPAASCNFTFPPYPPGQGKAQIAVNTTVPNPGETIEVSGQHYIGSESVKIYIGGTLGDDCDPTSYHGGIFVGTAHTNAQGAFDPPVVTPNLSGAQLLIGIGASGKPYDFDFLTLHIGGTSPTGTGTGPHTPAMTGVDVALLVVAGGVLLIVGYAFIRGGRRRATHV
jgi:hypothetical protein